MDSFEQQLLAAVDAIRSAEVVELVHIEPITFDPRGTAPVPAEKSTKTKPKKETGWFGRIEFHGETAKGNPSDKFWDCRLIEGRRGESGDLYSWLAQVRFGKCGYNGQTKTVGEYSSADYCLRELDMKRRKKLSEGYEVV